MSTIQEPVQIEVEDQPLLGAIAKPNMTMPGVLFVHGWGGSQERDMARAQEIASLGCVCLTFDMRGHARTQAQSRSVNREDNLRDVLAAYDLLADHPNVDPSAIAIIGSSYGAYLAAIATSLRRVRWLALRVPAQYRDADWLTPKSQFDRDDLNVYRQEPVDPENNRALGACARFDGGVLIVESECDDLVPRQTVLNYQSSFRRAHSVTYRIIDGADHALTERKHRRAYRRILVGWLQEMILSARAGRITLEYGDLD